MEKDQLLKFYEQNSNLKYNGTENITNQTLIHSGDKLVKSIKFDSNGK